MHAKGQKGQAHPSLITCESKVGKKAASIAGPVIGCDPGCETIGIVCYVFSCLHIIIYSLWGL